MCFQTAKFTSVYFASRNILWLEARVFHLLVAQLSQKATHFQDGPWAEFKEGCFRFFLKVDRA